jgi:phosphopantetheine--protein transferase-like protein
MGTPIEFSLTHTHGLVGCAVSSVPLGIDAEWVGRMCEPSLAKASLSDAEYHHWEKTDKTQQQRSFFRIWTIKEAYAKGTGQGLSLPFKNIHVDQSNPADPKVAMVPDWSIVWLGDGLAEHALAIAIHNQGHSILPIQVQSVDLK